MPILVWFWLYFFFLISDDLQQHYLMIYAPKSSSYLKLIFGEGLPNSWSEEVLWRMKVRRRMRMMTRMMLEDMWGIWKVDKQQGSSANILLFLIDNADSFGLVLGVFLLHSADYHQHIWWFMYLKHHLFEHNFWRGPSKLWGTPLQIEDEQTKDDKNVAADHLRGLEGWQTERLFQPTLCYSSLWQCPFLVWFWLYIFFLISADLQQHYLMIYAPKSWSHVIFWRGPSNLLI